MRSRSVDGETESPPPSGSERAAAQGAQHRPAQRHPGHHGHNSTPGRRAGPDPNHNPRHKPGPRTRTAGSGGCGPPSRPRSRSRPAGSGPAPGPAGSGDGSRLDSLRRPVPDKFTSLADRKVAAAGTAEGRAIEGGVAGVGFGDGVAHRRHRLTSRPQLSGGPNAPRPCHPRDRPRTPHSPARRSGLSHHRSAAALGMHRPRPDMDIGPPDRPNEPLGPLFGAQHDIGLLLAGTGAGLDRLAVVRRHRRAIGQGGGGFDCFFPISK